MFSQAFPSYLKRMLSIALNMSLKAMKKFVENKCRFGLMPPGILDFLQCLDAAKAALWLSDIPKPHISDPRVIMPYIDHRDNLELGRNAIYFLMEAIEERFMAAMVRQLVVTHQVDSLLWIHDGIWFAPYAPLAVIQQAVEFAQHQPQCPQVRVKYISLQDKRDKILATLAPPSVIATGAALRPTCPASHCSPTHACNQKKAH